MFRGKRESLCRKVQGVLSEYIDNSLGSEDKSLVEHHLEACEACSKELKSLRMTVQLLHRVPEVAVPRSFTVVAPKARREVAFGPSNLRWLRPATAVVAIALVVLLMGDVLNAFESNTGVNEGAPNLTSYDAVATPTPNPEQQIMVAVPGIMGQMSMATAKSVGYQDYTVVRTVVAPAVPQAESPPTFGVSGAGYVETTGAAGTVTDQSATGQVGNEGEEGVTWPLRQTEIGLGATVFVLLVLIIFARRQRTEGV